jgi:glycosyltransferase involved in cell wall biosynthesis
MSRRRIISRPTIRRFSAWRRLAARSLRRSAGRVDLALGDSEFNRQELETLGFNPTGVFPIAVDTARITQRVERPSVDAIADDRLVNFLFVGRIAPNKKIEDHIKLAEVYKRYIDAYYRFIFVGRCDVVPSYYATVRALDGRVPHAARSLRLHRSGAG